MGTAPWKASSRSRAEAAAAVALAALLAAGARAQTFGPQDAPIGGRPAGLGHAYSALAADAYAPVWNPAGLGFESTAQAALFHAAAFGGAPRQAASLAFPVREGKGVGLSLDAARGQAAYGLSYGQRVTARTSLGAAARYLDGRLEDGNARGYAADLGAYYRFDERLTAAAVAANLGGRTRPGDGPRPGAYEPQARLGAGYRAASWLTYALEGLYDRRGDMGVRTGLEATLLGMFSARVGFDTTVEGSPAMGLTAGVGLTWGGVTSLDLAYVPLGARSWEQVSLVVRFGREAPSPSIPAVWAAPAPAPKPAAARAPEPKRVHHLEPGATSGFVAEPPQPDWDKPKTPEPGEKPKAEQPVPPGMIWFDQ